MTNHINGCEDPEAVAGVDRGAVLERLAVLVRRAREDGIYEDDPEWRPIDELLARLDRFDDQEPHNGAIHIRRNVLGLEKSE